MFLIEFFILIKIYITGFNDSDFDISVQQLKMFINESDDPFEALSYLIGECNYGGRVTDDWDRRLIVTILTDFLNRKLAKSNSYSFNSEYLVLLHFSFRYSRRQILWRMTVTTREIFLFLLNLVIE